MHHSVVGEARLGRACVLSCLVALVLLAGFASPCLANAQAIPVATSMALLVASDGQFDALTLALETAGATPLQSFPPSGVIAVVSQSLGEGLESAGVVRSIYRSIIDDADIQSMPSPVAFVAGAWNALLSGPRVDPATAAPADATDDAMAAMEAGDLAGFALDPSLYQQSEYMVGKVAVNVVLVESSGAIDPSTEDWTTAEKQIAFQQIVAGLAWWQSMEPRARLQFVYDDHYTSPISVSYEPVNRPHSDERLWIREAMEHLGYAQPSYFTSVRYYNRATKERLGADWAFTVFLVDSSNDVDNHFADGYFAYAYIHGPFVVMTSECNGYGAENLAAVMAHETGHIFGALDEYAGAGVPPTAIGGYLGVPNGNSAYGGNPSVDSIMKGGTTAYTQRLISVYAAGQVGWRDSDGDGILDPVDTTVLTTASVDQSEDAVVLSGTALDAPWPSSTRNPYSINTIASAYYRVNGGPWRDMTADDGRFDSGSEAFSATLPPAPEGVWAVEVRAVNTVGNANVQTLSAIGTAGVEAVVTSVTASATATAANGVVELAGSADSRDGATVVTAIEYRVDAGPWHQAVAADGAFDSASEPFSLSIADLGAGTHSIEVRAWTSSPWTEAQVWQQSLTVEDTQSPSSESQVYVPLVVDL